MKIQFIDTNLLTRGRLEVAITRAESPLLFWVQLKSGWNDLMELEEALNLRMPQRSAHLHIGPENMKENMDVAVKDFRIWRRGFIKEINKTTLMVQVILGDWGRTTWCRMSDVYLLEDRFKNLSWQGIMCGLAHTGPPHQHHHLARRNQKPLLDVPFPARWMDQHNPSLAKGSRLS
ncbi:hypothetical protein RF55_17576 [Lasius niger]|uniref:Tudor domain-containing protein n=1 Tax=Lasius niger TaxID=67767 RepID=A0A0J7K271_LASNI|nr:hypothetical protein RF55_17576 [Lasius niger]